MSVRKITYTITDEYAGISIDRFLVKKGYTRQSIVRLKKTYRNAVINDEWMHLNHILKSGDVLTITISEDDSSEKIVPVELPFPIVYEDEDIVVVNKPSDMPIHPSLNNYENTLGNAAAYYYEQQNEKIVFRCVNRLDRDTSGLTIIAKHYLSAAILHTAMKAREIKREYIAIVEGDDIDDEGSICLPVGRVKESTIERAVDYDNGEYALTHYKKLKSGKGLALISLHLETGRTHQIRVHMKAIGHPLIGDWLYNPDNRLMNRQALHSYRLTFSHPISGEMMEFKAELPKDMRMFFDVDK